MNISKKMQAAISEQVKHEFYSAYLYLSMAVQCEAEGYPGCAHWMKLQWREEIAHGTRLMNWVARRGGRVTLQAIDQPPAEFGNLLAMFEQVLEHEQSVTAKIHKLYDMASSEKDHATTVILHWYVNEQVEEEATAETLFHQVKMLEGSPHGLLMLDRELAGRAPVAGGSPTE